MADTAGLALLRQAQRHIAAALEAAPEGDTLRAVAELTAAQSALAAMEMRETASRHPLGASS
jgi:hypothetical protein